MFSIGSITPSQDNVIRALLNTSLVLLLEQKNEEEKTIFFIKSEGFSSILHLQTRALTLFDFILSSFKKVEKIHEKSTKRAVNHLNSIYICFEISKRSDTHITNRRITKFELNNEDIVDASEQLVIVMLFSATVIHPIIHSYFDLLYNRRHQANAMKWDDFFLHGQYLNHISHFYPALVLDIHPNESKRHFVKTALQTNRPSIF